PGLGGYRHDHDLGARPEQHREDLLLHVEHPRVRLVRAAHELLADVAAERRRSRRDAEKILGGVRLGPAHRSTSSASAMSSSLSGASPRPIACWSAPTPSVPASSTNARVRSFNASRTEATSSMLAWPSIFTLRRSAQPRWAILLNAQSFCAVGLPASA